MPESVADRPTRSHEQIFLLSKSARYFYDAEAIREAGTIPAGTKFAKGSETRRSEKGINARPAEYAVATGTRNKRSVWTVATQPYAEAHFATFPPKLIEPCILAGTSEKGCCPMCAAPWERIVDRYRTRDDVRCDDLGTWRNTDLGSPISAQGVGHWRFASVTETKGWRAACACPDHAPVPSVVLDPFNGSGTTGLVSLEHRRRYIGIEINPEYIELTRKRLSCIQPGLF